MYSYSIRYDDYFDDLNKIIAKRFRHPEESIVYFMKTYMASKTGKRTLEHAVAERSHIPTAREIFGIATFARFMKGDIECIALIIERQHRVNSGIRRERKITRIKNDLEQFLTENNIKHTLRKSLTWDINKYIIGYLYEPGGDWLRVCYDVDDDTYVSRHLGQDDSAPVHGYDKLLEEILDFVK